MTWHGTVIKLFSFNGSAGTERSDNKIFNPNPNPSSVFKKLFQFPALQSKIYFSSFESNLIKEATAGRILEDVQQTFLTFLVCCAIKLSSCILKHHHKFAKFHMHYVCDKQKHTLPICNKFCFLLLKKLVLHQQNSYVFPTEHIVQMLKIGPRTTAILHEQAGKSHPTPLTG